jgi:hypothetical protein
MKDLSKSYTWYSKDWASDETVFKLTLSQRGLYRELIDRSYSTNNRIPLEWDLWGRLWNCTSTELTEILQRLEILGLLELNGEYCRIPSIEKRIRAIENGSKGGNPTLVKPIVKPLDQPNIKIKIKEKVNSKIPTLQEVINYFLENGYTTESAKKAFNYYNESLTPNSNQWKDGKGNPIKNWKMKMRGVWFTEENKPKRKNYQT